MTEGMPCRMGRDTMTEGMPCRIGAPASVAAASQRLSAEIATKLQNLRASAMPRWYPYLRIRSSAMFALAAALVGSRSWIAAPALSLALV